jgi:hypothetical protein
MKAVAWVLAFFLFLPLPAPANPGPDDSLDTLIRAAEQEFYSLEYPDRFARVAAILQVLEKLYPNEPYVWWAKARQAFFQKEPLYLTGNQDGLEAQKLALGEICHANADHCIKIAPENAECHLLKGSCYAMQASTWGNSFKSLKVAKPMDTEWAKAMELPSDFIHPMGTTTRQLAMALRGILYRLMPDSFWFRLLAGVRGNKEQALAWLEEASKGYIAQEPMVILERSAVAICLGRQKKRPDLEAKGVAWIREGLKLPTRDALDGYDKRNMRIVLENPDLACSYSREAFRDFTEGTLKKDVPKKR